MLCGEGFDGVLSFGEGAGGEDYVVIVAVVLGASSAEEESGQET